MTNALENILTRITELAHGAHERPQDDVAHDMRVIAKMLEAQAEMIDRGLREA